MAFLHEHIILPLSDLLRGEQVHKYLHLLRKAEYWTQKELDAFQQERLQLLFNHIAANVPFYREWFADTKLIPDEIKLQQLPIVSKSIMRQEGIERFASDCYSKKERILSRSSGSTGEPFSFYETKVSYSVNMAAKLRTWYQAGYHLGDWYMKIANGKRPQVLKQLQDIVNHCVYIPFYSLDDSALHEILATIDKKRPKYIRSYPAPLHLLAKYRNDHKGQYIHRPKHIFTTGSTLPDTYRNEIEQAFECDVIDSYSCEGTPNTYETSAHDGYHVTGYYGFIEILDSNNQPVTNGVGRVVSTDFWNMAHPFIRYDTQDLVEVRDGKITRIMGRECETLIEVDGTLLTVHNFTHYFADHFPSISGWQVVKHRNNDITFRIVADARFSDNEILTIKDHWHRILGTNINVVLVEQLPLMNNNKRLSIVEEQ